MKSVRSWSRTWPVVLVWLAVAAAAQMPQQAPREGSRREVNLSPDETAAHPAVGLVRAVFDALQRRDEAAVLALYEPLPEGLSGISLPRSVEGRRFAVWRHLKRGQLSNHRVRPIRTTDQFRSGQWVSVDAVSLIVDSESDSEVGPNLQTHKVISTLHVRRMKDGQYLLVQLELDQ